jgi:hypothetical protein
MNQLITREPNLTPVQKSFVDLRVGHKPVSEMSTVTLKRALVDILTKASFDMGSPMSDDPQILQFQTEACFKELNGKYGALTLPEVSEAFRRGIRGESGPFFGMCPKTYHQFLKWFFEFPERGKSWLAFLEAQSSVETSKKPIYYTPEHLKAIAIRTFGEYKDTGNIQGLGSFIAVIYDTVKELKKVDSLMDKLQWDEIKSEAIKSYDNEMTRGTPKHKLNNVLKLLDHSLENRSFEFHLKKIGLKFYFDSLIKNNKDLGI